MSRQNPPPTLSDVLDLKIRQVMTMMNCVAVGTIQSFDAASQTATINMNYKRIIKDAIPSNDGLTSQDKIVSYPLLVKCPCVVMNGGGAALTFPITAGDTCLILFCDRAIDTWFSSGNTDKPPALDRLHDLSDAVAIVGIRSSANPIASYDSAKLKILFGSGYITIDSSGNIAINGGTISITGSTITITGSSQVAINP